jgi:PPOX class probable F420-dependent enzyme
MPYHRMTDNDVRAFLTGDPPHTGKLATVRADGLPHVAPVWFAVDDDGSIVFTTGEDTVKGRNLARAGYAAMCIDDERPPFSFVMLEGPVELSADMDELRKWATVVGGRYMGEADAEAFGDRNAVPGELLARLRPGKVVSAKDLAG